MTESQRPTTDALLALKGTTVTLTDLLALFGERRRTYRTVPVITDALRVAGLATVPSFATCGRNASLLVMAEETARPGPGADGGAAGNEGDEADRAAHTGTDEDSGNHGDDESELAAGTLPQHSFKVGDIPCATAGLSSVEPNQALHQATYVMQSKNYSQIPVIVGDRDLRGVLTWSSIAIVYASGQTPTLAKCMTKEPFPVVETHSSLFAHLPMLTEHGYLLVRRNDGSFCGIITATDITNRFHETALPFFLVGEIEYWLRRWLGGRLGPDAIRAVQQKNKQTGDIADLMFGGYVQLLNVNSPNPQVCANARANWSTIGWHTNHAHFVQDLIHVKDIRNRIAHFDSDPLPEDSLGRLREFSVLVKSLVN
ncbi:CBS domain-containing protein [Streptomyces sp. NPDC050560]|uniref:CBS domain-containing protein n=1 Tax=Streptomyces sp. NPDC050560 TaxID=3365630 RepID=UPI0037BAB263